MGAPEVHPQTPGPAVLPLSQFLQLLAGQVGQEEGLVGLLGGGGDAGGVLAAPVVLALIQRPLPQLGEEMAVLVGVGPQGPLHQVPGPGEAPLPAVLGVLRGVVGVAVPALREARAVVVVGAAGARVPLAVVEVLIPGLRQGVQVDLVAVGGIVLVVVLPVGVGVQPGEHGAPGGTAHGGHAVGVGKLHPLGGEGLEAGAHGPGAALEHAVAVVGLVVVEDIDDVGLLSHGNSSYCSMFSSRPAAGCAGSARWCSRCGRPCRWCTDSDP